MCLWLEREGGIIETESTKRESSGMLFEGEVMLLEADTSAFFLFGGNWVKYSQDPSVDLLSCKSDS